MWSVAKINSVFPGMRESLGMCPPLGAPDLCGPVSRAPSPYGPQTLPEKPTPRVSNVQKRPFGRGADAPNVFPIAVPAPGRGFPPQPLSDCGAGAAAWVPAVLLRDRQHSSSFC